VIDKVCGVHQNISTYLYTKVRDHVIILLSRQIYSNILPYCLTLTEGRVLRVEDGRREEERSEVMYCIVRDTYLYIIDVRTDHAVLCVVLFGTHRSIY